jgi:hypothetical protein
VLHGIPFDHAAALQVQSMDRVFSFLKPGFVTQQLTNMQFVNAMSKLAIRYSKDGKFQVRSHG